MASLFAEAGAAVIDSDGLNRAQLRSGEVIETLQSWWGESICDASGQLSRQRIAEIIFGDPAQRRRLEGLLHPRIARHRERLIEAYQTDASVQAIVLDTPLLIEAQLDRGCDAVVFVEADYAVRRERVRRLRGWPEGEWNRRENSQNALDKKRSKADYIVVNNSSDRDELRFAVQDLLTRLGLSGNTGA